jgi:hypothetical protein
MKPRILCRIIRAMYVQSRNDANDRQGGKDHTEQDFSGHPGLQETKVKDPNDNKKNVGTKNNGRDADKIGGKKSRRAFLPPQQIES